MASVKWLQRLIVTKHPFKGFFQSLDYSIFVEQHGAPTLLPITEMQVKAEIARPVRNARVTAGSVYRVCGAAWTGEGQIAKVEISTDGGKSWAPGTLTGPPMPFTWRLWEFAWQVPARSGPVQLMVRATDDRGRTQPKERDKKLRNSMISHVVPLEVTIV